MIYWQSLRANPLSLCTMKAFDICKWQLGRIFRSFHKNQSNLARAIWMNNFKAFARRSWRSRSAGCLHHRAGWLCMKKVKKTYHFEMKIWTNLGIHTERVLRRNSISNTRQQIRALGFENQSQRFSSFFFRIFPFLERRSVNINSGSHLYSHFLCSTIWFSFSPPFQSCLKSRFGFTQHGTRLCTTVRWELYSQFRKLQLNIYLRGGGEIVDILILHMSGRNA